MRAVQATSFGNPADVLKVGDIPDLKPVGAEVVVKVLSAGIGFPDLLMCRGEYQVRPEPPFTPGMEVCGQVAAVGPDASGAVVGDRVIGIASGLYGGFAEYCSIEPSLMFAAPTSFDDRAAAAFCISYQTAWFACKRRARLEEGETILVFAAGGGVGSATVQLGKALGARVIAVVGSDEKAAVAAESGAELVINRHDEDVIAKARDFTGGHGVDVVVDSVGGEGYKVATKCVAFEGRIVVVGFSSGTIPQVRLNHSLLKNYANVGLHWSLYTKFRPDLVRSCQTELNALADNGALSPVVGGVVGLDGVADVMRRLADGYTVGRSIVVP